ncbi:MAG: oxidoreductase-like domain-containing protein [Gammaproteobacteria bacterium]
MTIIKQDRPPKPREPDLSECCQRNCVNCVFVYYQKALDRWQKKVEEIEAPGS